ncbi:MAG: BsaWI family type II restriction enzyme [Chloroflexi bacterium]|jgi:type II restriction enzyme|nr:BsaWI family type II restriction enzyme [Chloroflexota bacterium]
MKYTDNFNNILLPILQKYLTKCDQAEIHKYFFDILDETKKIYQIRNSDKNGQKWRNESGTMLEQLVIYFLHKEIMKLGYDITTDNEINSSNYGILEKVWHNIVLKYGKYSILPDSDIVIYNPNTAEVKAIISCKSSVRERFAQSLYWKVKLSTNDRTKHIKMYFVTVDKEYNEKGTGFKKSSLDIQENKEPTKPRILLEYEMDGVYVTRYMKNETDKVKMFDKFIGDLKMLICQ